MGTIEAAPVTGEPKPASTVEEKLVTLEEKFAALEKKYNELQEKVVKTAEGAGAQDAAAGTADKDKESTEKGAVPISRARILINRTDPVSGERKDQLPTDTPSGATKTTEIFYAFTIRKYVYDTVDDNYGEIEITNLDLWELLKQLLGHYPYHIFQGPPATLYSPYEAFIFEWETLEKATKEEMKNDNDKQARSDLKLLLETLSSGSGDPKLDRYFKTCESNREQKSVTFETLWTIFPPGALVYGRPFQGEDQVFIVQDNVRPWPYMRSSRREPSPWNLLCWTYDWDGKMFRRMSLKLEFEQFDSHKPITALPYYPFELNGNCNTIKEALVERGVRYRELCTAKQGARMFNYNGEAVFGKKGFSGVQGDDDNDDDSTSTFDAEAEFLRRGMRMPSSVISGAAIRSSKVDSTVMVDFESYFRYGPAVAKVGTLMPNVDNDECDCLQCRANKALSKIYRTRFDEDACQRNSWEDEQYMLCPPRVLGYILRDKQWAQLQVTLLKTIPKKDPTNSWSSRLKLADGNETKDMLMNLVTGHGTTESTSGKDGLDVDDIVANKGKGLVILLYGPPGVGKTSTAETVAIAARKPLFSISVADVGTKAKNVENNLAKIFALATSWRAILLIDEADVFLESRGRGLGSNTERNALVSVFLRVLEYYQGILMLTTNQIAQFDVAVQSRIHIAIKYGSLKKDQTLAIFKGFLRPLDQQGLIKDMDGIEEWLCDDVWKMGFDGRQIRNIVTSALGIARAEGKNKLEKKHLKLVLSNVKDFKDEFIRQYEKYKNDQQGMI